MTRACLATSILLLSLAPARTSHQTGAQDSGSPCVVYVLATDSQNLPITNLARTDFVVKEDGNVRDVVSAEVATTPLRIAVIVDDNGTGIFRYGLGQFAQRLQGRAQLSFRMVTGQVRKITDYTDDVQAWINGIGQFGVRPGTPDGGQLLEGISEAAKDLKTQETRRPVILALTVGGEEHSPLFARDVLEQLHDSRAVLYVVFAGSSAIRSPNAASKPADLLEGNHNLDQVLGDGPKQSGGRRRDVIATQALLTDLQQIAGELTSQYAVTYLRPADRRAPQKIQITVPRRGVNVIAPTRAPR